jgi:hypothetical protein
MWLILRGLTGLEKHSHFDFNFKVCCRYWNEFTHPQSTLYALESECQGAIDWIDESWELALIIPHLFFPVAFLTT